MNGSAAVALTRERLTTRELLLYAVLGLVTGIVTYLDFRAPIPVTIVLIIFYLAVAKPRIGIFMLPFFTITKYIVPIANPMTALMFIAVFVRCALRKKAPASHPLMYLYVLFTTVCLLSIVRVESVVGAFTWFLDFIMLYTLLFVFLNTVEDMKMAKDAMYGFMFGLLVLVMFMLRMYMTGELARALTRGHIENPSFLLKAIGEGNLFSASLLCITPFAIAMAWHQKTRRRTILQWVLAIALIFGILLTNSRASLMCMVLLFSFFFPLEWKRRSVKIFAVVLIACILAVAPKLFMMKFGKGGEAITHDYSKMVRDSLLHGGARMFYDNFFTGVGLGNFSYVFLRDYVPRDIVLEAYRHAKAAHNMYVEIAAETGFLGILGFLAFLVLTHQRLWAQRNYFRKTGDEESSSFCEGLFFGYMGFCLNGIFLSSQFVRIFWVIAAIAMAIDVIIRKQKAAAGKSAAPASGTSPCAG